MSEGARPYYILVVDDEPDNSDLLSRRLMRRGYEVSCASGAEQAMIAIDSRTPNLVLLDVLMPKVSGLDLLVQLRREPKTADLPVILVSALDETNDIVRGLQLGANDYVTKPVNMPVLLARIETHLKGVSMLMKLRAQGEMLEQLAAFDGLTGVYNRRSLQDALEGEIGRSRRYGRPISVMMLDLDLFKDINDGYGHIFGDEVLKQFSARAAESLRDSDLLCRFGGEEFTVILPETDHPGAVQVAERVRHSTAAEPFLVQGVPVSLTVSIGLATWKNAQEGTADQLLESADKALYEAKKNGRNRVCCITEEK
jgi:two-component system, cell cycle response regulator